MDEGKEEELDTSICRACKKSCKRLLQHLNLSTKCKRQYGEDYDQLKEDIAAQKIQHKKSYYKENRNTIRKKQADYKDKNKDKINKQQAAYKNEHREQIYGQQASYKKENRESINENQTKYR